MKSSQIGLLTLMGLFVFYLLRLRSTATDRLMYLGLAFFGAVMILYPEVTNQLANAVGIGRGADLVFYFFIVFCLFHFATSAATMRRMQRDLTSLAQQLALRNSDAQPGG